MNPSLKEKIDRHKAELANEGRVEVTLIKGRNDSTTLILTAYEAVWRP